MIHRELLHTLSTQLAEIPAVVLLGPRQVGKTTLAHSLAQSQDSLYLDLESPSDQAKLTDPELYLSTHQGKLVILDEIHRLPHLFPILRGIIDTRKRQGHHSGQFLLLGSASLELLKQSSETLAGRISYLELHPIHILEIASTQLTDLWLRGGFPTSLLAKSDASSLRWRLNFIRSYLERDIPQFGPRIAAETLRRFWTMLAHRQGTLLNLAQIASGLGITGRTASHYLDLMIDLLLVRRLPPWHTNTNKRLVKSPKVYIRDSGLVHALLGIQNEDALLGHPIVGMSWEGFIISTLLALLPNTIEPYFYRTATGAEIDLLLHFPDNTVWAIEIKRTLSPTISKGFHLACDDLHPTQRFIVYAGTERYPLTSTTTAISLPDLAKQISTAIG